LDELCQKLERRGHSRDVYAQALDDLIRRGWISEEADKYRVTQKGQVLRQEAEDKTDRYFYAPWACLSKHESEELRDLLTQLRDGLR
jgi:DNA-binding MarR family transcriptional regulator